jgi:hypothetical protein
MRYGFALHPKELKTWISSELTGNSYILEIEHFLVAQFRPELISRN